MVMELTSFGELTSFKIGDDMVTPIFHQIFQLYVSLPYGHSFESLKYFYPK